MKHGLTQQLLHYLSVNDIPTLWFADENTLPILASLSNHQQPLHIISNRYDIYTLAADKGLSCEFSDFTLNNLPFTPSRIVYRISKEKTLSHYLFNQACSHLSNNGELFIGGQKQQGIKSYADTLNKKMQMVGKLTKSGNDYSGVFVKTENSQPLDNCHYHNMQLVTPKEAKIDFYSKSGVFGWNKVDQGSQLLIQHIGDIIDTLPSTPNTILDLGCGYGWIFLNLIEYYQNRQTIDKDKFSITATDNNAAALACAQKNAAQYELNISVMPSDAGDEIKTTFDLIVCNPPFHQGFQHDKSLTEKFFTQAYNHLKPGGIAIFVVNEFIKPTFANQYHVEIKEYIRNKSYKIITLTRNR